MQEFFTLLSFLECEYYKKGGGAGYRNGRWAGGITAVFSEHPLSLKNSYHPAVTGSPWVDSTGCNRPMSDVHPSASALKLAPLSVCLISVVLCLGVGNIRPRKIQFTKSRQKAMKGLGMIKFPNQKKGHTVNYKDLCRDHPRNKGLIRPF